MNVQLSFIGKDSVPFKRTLDVPDDIAKELQKLTENKKASDEIFDKISSGDVSSFLNEAYDGISPKVLRTAKCNQVLVEELKKQTVTKASTEQEKIRALYRANLAIAKTLNHQKNVAKNAKEQEAKAKDKVVASKEKLKALKEAQEVKLEKLKADQKKARAKGDKEKLAKLKEKKAKMEAQLERAKARIDSNEFKYEKRKETKDINLGTSLGAYADFRIIYSWCKDMDLDPHKIYSKALYEKSQWATDTPAKFWRTAF